MHGGVFSASVFLKKIEETVDKKVCFDYYNNHFAAVAQLVEQWTENPCVVGPIPTGGIKTPEVSGVFFYVFEIIGKCVIITYIPVYKRRMINYEIT